MCECFLPPTGPAALLLPVRTSRMPRPCAWTVGSTSTCVAWSGQSSHGPGDFSCLVQATLKRQWLRLQAVRCGGLRVDGKISKFDQVWWFVVYRDPHLKDMLLCQCHLPGNILKPLQNPNRSTMPVETTRRLSKTFVQSFGFTLELFEKMASRANHPRPPSVGISWQRSIHGVKLDIKRANA